MNFFSTVFAVVATEFVVSVREVEFVIELTVK
jgi:hypothetical protein